MLRAILKKYGVTQAGLAKTLGVSRAAVNFWATEREAIPAIRAEEIVVLLGLDPNEAEALLAGATPGPGRLPAAEEEPQTFLDWLIRFDGASAHLGETYAERVRALAQVAKVPVGTALRWIAGERRVPEETVLGAFAKAWGSLPAHPFYLAGEVGRVASEAVAVQAAVERAVYDLEAAGPLTFDAVEDAIFDARADWLADPSVEVGAGFPLVDIPAIYTDTAQAFRDARGA